MTPAEQEVTERLQEYAGRLSVTVADVGQARVALRQRFADRTHRRIGLALLAATAAVAFVVGGAVLYRGTEALAPNPPVATPPAVHHSANDGPPLTLQALTGIWKITADREPSLLVRFAADGTYYFDDQARIGAEAASRGTYRVHGHTITFTNLGGYACPTADAWVWRVETSTTGLLRIVITKAAAADCQESVGTEWVLTRVSPQSPAGAQLTGDATAGERLSVRNESQLIGIWLQQGTGRLLHLALHGSYALDDGGVLDSAPDDVGTFVRSGPGSLQLTSMAGARDCAPGDRAAWKGVRLTATSLTVDVGHDTCPARGDLAGRWLLLSRGA
jgi:hypothetical protein